MMKRFLSNFGNPRGIGGLIAGRIMLARNRELNAWVAGTDFGSESLAAVSGAS